MKNKNIIFIISFCILLIILMHNFCFAATSTKMDTSITIDPTAANESETQTRKFLGAIQLVGSVASVIALAVIGIRYMMSSLEEKAEMKGVLIYYVIGCALVFATSNLLSVVYNAIIDLNL